MTSSQAAHAVVEGGGVRQGVGTGEAGGEKFAVEQLFRSRPLACQNHLEGIFIPIVVGDPERRRAGSRGEGRKPYAEA